MLRIAPGFPIENSNWVATDALGRRLPDFKRTGPVKNGKWVGLFYYIWIGGHTPTDTIYDITKSLQPGIRSAPYIPQDKKLSVNYKHFKELFRSKYP